MFNNFLEKLINEESLIDIGNQGKATQSSLSQWSKENDPQRAVTGVDFYDFSFHTDKEKNPWWQIEWEQAIPLQYIIINNRKKKPFDRISMPLRVTVITQNKEVNIYDGNVLFGSLPLSLPLVLPLQGFYDVKKVKIELQDFNYLHLCNIIFLRKKSLQEEKGKLVFIANRTDGLGERLRALLHAMLLADTCNGDFYFSWDNQWVVGDKYLSVATHNNIFHEDFLKVHYLDKEYIDKNLNLVTLGELGGQIIYENVKNFDGIQVEQSSRRYLHFFDKIKFNKSIDNIKNYAMNLDISNNVVAIHIRSGDIVYGKHACSELFYDKIQPIYVVEKIIAMLQESKIPIILFSLEKELCQYLVDKYCVQYADNLTNKDWTDVQKAFFEIILMSRCAKIFAQNSGFAILPTLVGDSKKISYDQFLSRAELKEAFWQSLQNDGLLSLNCLVVNNQLKAFTIAHFLNSFFSEISLIEKTRLVEYLIDLDNDNVFYRFIKAVVLYEGDKNSEADEILLKELKKGTEGEIYFLAKNIFWRKKSTLSSYIYYFDKASKKSIVATIMVLLNDFYFYKKVDIEYYQSIINEAKQHNSIVAGLDLLEKNLNEFTKS